MDCVTRGNIELCEAKEFKKSSLFTRGGKQSAQQEGETVGFWRGLAQSIFGGAKDFPGVDHSQRPRLDIRNAQLPNQNVVMNNMDYCKNSGMLVANMKPDSSGVIHLPLDKLKGYGFFVLVFCDLHSTLVLELHDKTDQLVKREMRPQHIMKPKEILQVNYDLHMSDKIHKVEVTGVQGTQSAVVEDLETLRESLLCLAGSEVDKQEIGEWTFLTKWHSLAQNEKESKWDKYGGHELAIFTFLRDQPFFLNFIQPLLRSKVHQTFIDKLLSNFDQNTDPIVDWSELASFQKIPTLSAVELLLLVLLTPKSDTALRNHILKYVESRVGSKAPDNSKVKNTWESLLNRSSSNQDSEDEESVASATNKKQAPADTPSSSGRPALAKPIQLDGLLSSQLQPSSVGGKQGAKRAILSREGQCLGDEKKSIPFGDDDYEPGFVKIEEVSNPIIIEEYKKAPLATEFKERQEHFVGQYSAIPLNNYWLKIYQHISNERSKGVSPSELLNPEHWGFVSEDLLFMTHSTAEVVAALTTAPISSKKSKVTPLEVSSTGLKYIGNLPYFVLTKSSKIESSSEPLQLDVVVAQKFYDPQDKLLYDEKDPKIFTIKEISEFLTAKIYESRVSISNLSESSCSIELHTQVPEGALAVYQLEDFSTSTKEINPMETRMFTFKFYFPAVGEYRVYPATVTKNNRFVSCAKQGKDTLGDSEFKLKVVEDYRPESKPLETLQDMISFGGPEDILRFMGDKNLFNTNLFDISKIRWVAKTSKQNFLGLVSLLRKNFIFDQAIWAYSIHHCCYHEFLELMKVIAVTFVSSCKYIDLGNNILIDRFTPLEYDPLVNPRAHEIQQKGVNIRNQAFRETYTNFLVYCCEKIVLSPEDKVVLLAYMVLQDRVTDAQELLGKLNFEEVYRRGYSTIQLDYIRAYLCLYSESPEFPTAREMAVKYERFADLSWRERFLKVKSQLEEYDKGRVTVTPRDQTTGVQVRSNKELAEKAEFLRIEKTSSQGVHLTYKNIDRLKVKFYKFDMELLFSMDPFGENKSRGVESVEANHELKFRVVKVDEFKTSVVSIPEAVQGSNFIVQVNGVDKFDVTQVYDCSLTAHVDNEYGLVKVFDPQGKPLSACYVKCFIKDKTKRIRFYKDGYTDFRGSFDYASLNSDGLGNIEEFSILVINQEYGSKILQAKAPGAVGRITQLTTNDEVSQEEAAEKFVESYHTHFFKLGSTPELA